MVDAIIAQYEEVWPEGDATGPPLVLGETNSLYNEGKPGLSNSFGAALWGVDFNLYSASAGIKRVHMHMGTDYRVSSSFSLPRTVLAGWLTMGIRICVYIVRLLAAH